MHAGRDSQRAAKRAGHVVAQCVTKDDALIVSDRCGSDTQQGLDRRSVASVKFDSFLQGTCQRGAARAIHDKVHSYTAKINDLDSRLVRECHGNLSC